MRTPFRRNASKEDRCLPANRSLLFKEIKWTHSITVRHSRQKILWKILYQQKCTRWLLPSEVDHCIQGLNMLILRPNRQEHLVSAVFHAIKHMDLLRPLHSRGTGAGTTVLSPPPLCLNWILVCTCSESTANTHRQSTKQKKWGSLCSLLLWTVKQTVDCCLEFGFLFTCSSSQITFPDDQNVAVILGFLSFINTLPTSRLCMGL